jgi:ribonucleotide reductase beta subunit family protein with ferritin-like domain
MKLTQKRLTYKPFHYPEAFDFWMLQQQAHWLATEVPLNQDVIDWHNNLTESEKSVIGGILKGFTQTEIVVNDYWANRVTKWFKHPEIVMAATAMASAECFDDQTELLTSVGWKSVVDINDKDKIAQYDKDTREISFIVPMKVVCYDYNGIMHHYKNERTDICVTPNHDLILIHPSTRKVSKRKSFEGKWGRNYQYPLSGIGTGEETDLSNYERLLIAIQADGCLRGNCPSVPDHHRTCDINISKQRKIERLEFLLNSLSVNFSKTENNETTKYTFVVPGNVQVSSIKSFDYIDISTFSKQKANLFIEELLLWDGDQVKNWYSTNKKAVDVVQSIATLADIRSTIGINRTKQQTSKIELPQGGNAKNGGNDCYVMGFSENVNKTYPYRKEIQYSGKVYCVSVPTQNLISRRNNKVSFTGNTIHTHAYSLLDETLGFDDYESFYQEPTVKEKIDRLLDLPGNSKVDIAKSLAVFSAFTEGVSLFSSFAVLLHFSRKNKMKGMSQIVTWSSKDESLHAEFGCYLFRTFIEENSEIWTDEFKKELYQAARDTVQMEDNFIDKVFEMGSIEGLTKEDLKVFVRNRANNQLGKIGLKQNWKNIDKDALERMSWFDMLVAAPRLDDFFAIKPTDYSKGSVKFDDDMF